MDAGSSFIVRRQREYDEDDGFALVTDRDGSQLLQRGHVQHRALGAEPLEQRVADEIGLKWRTARLWSPPVDELSVREAIVFAYVRADLPMPATIERADGPFSGVAIAGTLGCTFAWSGFVPEAIHGWQLASLPHHTRNVSDEGFM
ncbi:hypothetical protein BH11MYX4_BH11MYX4_49600 [soil metagenome]